MKIIKQHPTPSTDQRRPHPAGQAADSAAPRRLSIRRLIADSELLIPASLFSRQGAA